MSNTFNLSDIEEPHWLIGGQICREQALRDVGWRAEHLLLHAVRVRPKIEYSLNKGIFTEKTPAEYNHQRQMSALERDLMLKDDELKNAKAKLETAFDVLEILGYKRIQR